jgi:hypothetical protein
LFKRFKVGLYVYERPVIVDIVAEHGVGCRCMHGESCD